MTAFNIASLLTDAAQKWPERLAVIAPHRLDVLGRGQLSYQELDEGSDRLAAQLLRDGAVPGSRVIVLVKPGLDFVTIIFGLFKAGLVPVMVDPGMGLSRMLRCLGEGRPSGLIGITAAHIFSFLAPRHFRSIKTRVTVGQALGWGGRTLAGIMTAPLEAAPQVPVPTKADDLAAILFTSGSTGPAKGVVYTHAMFRAQVEAIREGLDIQGGGCDLATFPLFGLFAPALGLTSVIPNINAAKPGRAFAKNLIDPIIKYGVSSMFASPTLVGNMARYAAQNNMKLPTLRRVIMAGAPAQPPVVAAFTALMSPAEGTMQTPYGATEGVPLTTILGTEILGETGKATAAGQGMCVGRPLSGVELKIIKISDAPITNFSNDLLLPAGEIGEIIAQGPMVSPAYFERPADTAKAIIAAGDTFWRRMGDVGWLDAEGRLWFCGRKAHRVETESGPLFTIPCEAIFNQHPLVARAALVGVGKPDTQRPVIIIEPRSWRSLNWNALKTELAALTQTAPHTRPITTFLKCRAFPVDVRHNAKINRENLALWAARQLAC